jgi:LPS-assembly lipoprotein
MNRRAAFLLSSLALVALPLLAGCGFTPVYDTAGRGIGPVTIQTIDSRTGFFLQQELSRRAALEKSEGTPRTLSVALANVFRNTNLRQDSFYNRTQLQITATWTLRDSTQTEPKTGRVVVTVGYDTADQAFGDVALQADAEERAAVMLAERIWADIAVRAPRTPRR